LSAVALAGCNKTATTPTAPAEPVKVIVTYPTTDGITDTEEFPGHLDPVAKVDVRSRVTGYLEKIHFVDGADVKAGDRLFQIDPLPYAAEAERAKAAVTQAVAKRDRLKKDYDRMNSALVGAVSKEELDRVTGDLAEAEAAVQVATANQKLADTNLAYTKVVAKTTGRISRRMVDEGNLVKADDTILTTIVSHDPVYASFDVDERTLLRLSEKVVKGEIPSLRVNPEDPKKPIEVEIALSDDKGFVHKGTIDFTDNQVNPRTGTFRIRAVLENPTGLFSPGLYVRIRFPVGRKHDAVMVPEEAIGSDQGRKFVFVIADAKKIPPTDPADPIKGEGVVRDRKVELGPAYGSKRVVKDGIKADDIVVVRGLQRLRNDTKVGFLWPAKPTEKPASDPPTKSVTATVSGGRE
jgi:RND family efflux transporter MFP subunit